MARTRYDFRENSAGNKVAMANDKLAVLAIAMGAILYVILLFLNLDRWYVSVSTVNQDSSLEPPDAGSGLMFRFTSKKPVERVKSETAEQHPIVVKPGSQRSQERTTEVKQQTATTETHRPTYRPPLVPRELLTAVPEIEHTASSLSEPWLASRITSSPIPVDRSTKETDVNSNEPIGGSNLPVTAGGTLVDTDSVVLGRTVGATSDELPEQPQVTLSESVPSAPSIESDIQPTTGEPNAMDLEDDEQQMVFTIPDASFVLPVPMLMPRLKSVLAWQTGASILDAGNYALTQIPDSRQPLIPLSFELSSPGPCYFGTPLPNGSVSYNFQSGTPLLLQVGGSAEASEPESFKEYLAANETDHLVASKVNESDKVVQIKVQSKTPLWIQPGYCQTKLSDGVGYFHPFARHFMADEVLFAEIVGIPENTSGTEGQQFLDRHSMLLRQLSAMIKFLYRLQRVEPKFGCTKFVCKIDYLETDPDANTTVTHMENFFQEFTRDYTTFELFRSYVILKSLQDHPMHDAVADHMRRSCLLHISKVEKNELLSSREDFALKSYFFNDLLQPRDDAHAILVIELYQKLNQSLIPTGGLVSQKWEDLPDALTDGLDPKTRSPEQLIALHQYPSVKR
ncbi:hypothetical protein HDE_12910 [Halotydeus destructor]|nr:hypothetical protein HDE_12910 [Halotydeus destructor]